MNDFIYRLTTSIAREFKDYVHRFEDLKKNMMFNSPKKHNRNISKSDWRTITILMNYKAKATFLNLKNSMKRCSC